MSCTTFKKDPLDKRKVTIDWSEWLGSSTISSAAWTVPSGITEADSSNTSTATVNYFSGGTDGQQYEIACSITTADAVARIKTQRFLISVEDSC